MTRAKTTPVKTTFGNIEELAGSFGYHGDKGYRKVFDTIPLKDVRERCVEYLIPTVKETFDWLVERIEGFIAANDHETATMLLRKAVMYEGEGKQKVVDLMVDCAHSIRNRNKSLGQLRDQSKALKEVLVILCGKLHREPELYSQRVNSLFCRLLAYLSHTEENARIRQRILRVIGRVGDASFLEQLKRETTHANTIALMGYLYDSDTINFEALRLLVIAHLENILEKSVNK